MTARHILPALAASLIICTAPGCDTTDDGTPADRAVIEGYIDSDGYVTVYFTSSLNPRESTVIADKLIRWGTVSIDDGETTWYLTGSLSKEQLPPYRYYTFDFKGQPGRTYRLHAEYNGLTADAVSTMPAPTPIDSIAVEHIAGNDTLRAATMYFTAPADCPAYYYVTLREPRRGSRSYPGLLGVAEATRPGSCVTVPVCKPKLMTDTTRYVPQLRVGSEYEVSLCRVERQVYEYWQAYNDALMFGGSMFVGGSQSLPGNVTGGYGIFTARGVTTTLLTVR